MFGLVAHPTVTIVKVRPTAAMKAIFPIDEPPHLIGGQTVLMTYLRTMSPRPPKVPVFFRQIVYPTRGLLPIRDIPGTRLRRSFRTSPPGQRPSSGIFRPRKHAPFLRPRVRLVETEPSASFEGKEMFIRTEGHWVLPAPYPSDSSLTKISKWPRALVIPDPHVCT